MLGDETPLVTYATAQSIRDIMKKLNARAQKGASAALLYLKQHKGSLRSNSKSYKDIVTSIVTSNNPMGSAKAALRELQRASRQKAKSSLEQEVMEVYLRHERKITTATLDDVVALVRRGYPREVFDPTHWNLVDHFEELIFAAHQKLTLGDLKKLASNLTQISVMVNGKWQGYEGR